MTIKKSNIICTPIISFTVNIIKKQMHMDMCSIMVPADFVSDVQLGVMEGKFLCTDIK